MSENLRIRLHHGVDMKYDCRLSIAVVGCILIIVVFLVTQPFWNYTMETAFREARWLERRLRRWGSLFGSQRDEWIWSSSWISTPGGVLELPTSW